MQKIERSRWGKDHWTTFAYLCQCVIDHGGILDADKMRTDRDIHPVEYSAKRHQSMLIEGARYPTRLNDGESIVGHDDWSCVKDFIEDGLVTRIFLENHKLDRFELTDEGWLLWFEFQMHIANNRAWSTTFEQKGIVKWGDLL